MTLTSEQYWDQGSSQLHSLIEEIDSIVSILPTGRQAKVRELLDGPIGAQFMIAPASTRRSYHNAFPCGLAMHSISVAKSAVKIAEALAPGRWSKDKLVFCGLFHDLGKAGSVNNPFYIQTKEEWKRRREEHYEVNMNLWMPNSELGLWTLSQYGITLDHEEYAAIRLNDGPGAPENKSWDFRTPQLAMVIHWADAWSTEQEKAAAR